MFVFVVIDGSLAWSPSSRRAWIEIVNLQRGFRQTEVALLAEGVDRNLSRLINSRVKSKVALLAEGVDRNACEHTLLSKKYESPSSRRAWIEIDP